MADFLIQATLSNFVVASILAVIVWIVQRRVGSASLSNLLWAFVLIKMLTPPLVALPVLDVPRVSTHEMACDDLVLEVTDAEVHRYGNALLNVAELLTAAAIRPPVVASAMNSGGSLEQRLKMMIVKQTREVSSSMRMAIVTVAACIFPLGVVYAQDFEGVERRLGGAVEAGELSLEQAKLMLDALRRSTSAREMDAKKRRYMQFVATSRKHFVNRSLNWSPYMAAELDAGVQNDSDCGKRKG